MNHVTGDKRNKKTEIPSSAALFLTILVVSVILAIVTEWNIVLRGGIAVIAGILAAAITFAIVNRKHRS